MSEIVLCVICTESLVTEEASYLFCGHVYHKSCINEWIRSCTVPNKPCPTCRTVFSNVYPVFFSTDVDEKLVELERQLEEAKQQVEQAKQQVEQAKQQVEQAKQQVEQAEQQTKKAEEKNKALKKKLKKVKRRVIKLDCAAQKKERTTRQLKLEVLKHTTLQKKAEKERDDTKAVCNMLKLSDSITANTTATATGTSSVTAAAATIETTIPAVISSARTIRAVTSSETTIPAAATSAVTSAAISPAISPLISPAASLETSLATLAATLVSTSTSSIDAVVPFRGNKRSRSVAELDSVDPDNMEGSAEAVERERKRSQAIAYIIFHHLHRLSN